MKLLLYKMNCDKSQIVPFIFQRYFKGFPGPMLQSKILARNLYE